MKTEVSVRDIQVQLCQLIAADFNGDERKVQSEDGDERKVQSEDGDERKVQSEDGDERKVQSEGGNERKVPSEDDFKMSDSPTNVNHSSTNSQTNEKKNLQEPHNPQSNLNQSLPSLNKNDELQTINCYFNQSLMKINQLKDFLTTTKIDELNVAKNPKLKALSTFNSREVNKASAILEKIRRSYVSLPSEDEIMEFLVKRDYAKRSAAKYNYQQNQRKRLQHARAELVEEYNKKLKATTDNINAESAVAYEYFNR